MYIYSNGRCEKLDNVHTFLQFDHLIDIRSNFERFFSCEDSWVHFPFRLIREGNHLPEHIQYHQKLYVFNGCPYGIVTKKAVDQLTNVGYVNCFTLTATDAARR